jgi:hypothetical protein
MDTAFRHGIGRGRASASVTPQRSPGRVETHEYTRLLISDGSYGADDLRDKTLYWGITQVAETNGFRLWKLNEPPG